MALNASDCADLIVTQLKALNPEVAGVQEVKLNCDILSPLIYTINKSL